MSIYEPLGMASEFVTENCNPVYGSACLEMTLDFLRRCAIVNLSGQMRARLTLYCAK